MRRPSSRWIAAAALAASLWLVVFGILWQYLGGPYNTGVGHGAVLAWRLVAVSDVAFEDATAREIKLRVHSTLPGGRTLLIPYSYSGFFQVSFGLLVALFIATPGLSLLRRCAGCAAAMPALFVFHSLYLVWALHLNIASSVLPHLGRDPGVAVEWMRGFLAVTKHLFPILLWGGISLILFRRHSNRNWMRTPERRRHGLVKGSRRVPRRESEGTR